MRYLIESIPHETQRYETCGDWYDQDGTTRITASKLSDWRYEFLIALHELIESALCRHAGISEASVTDFDLQYNGTGEPGDHEDAPYRFAHQVATGVERTVAALLGVNWQTYEREVDSL